MLLHINSSRANIWLVLCWLPVYRNPPYLSGLETGNVSKLTHKIRKRSRNSISVMCLIPVQRHHQIILKIDKTFYSRKAKTFLRQTFCRTSNMHVSIRIQMHYQRLKLSKLRCLFLLHTHDIFSLFYLSDQLDIFLRFLPKPVHTHIF